MDFAVRTYEWLMKLPEPWNWIIGTILSLGLIGFTIYRMFKFVKRDMIAIKERVGKPILRYGPRFGKNRLGKAELARRIKIDNELIVEHQENPIYGEPVMRGAGPLILNPVTETIELVESRERPVKIVDFPVMIDRDDYRGFKLSITVTVKMKDAYRWRYRSMEVDTQIASILTDRLHDVCNKLGALPVRENVGECLKLYLEVLQTEDRQHVEYDTLDSELAQLLREFLKKDKIQGVLAKYGGFASVVYLDQIEDIYEGWQPQATLQVADALRRNESRALWPPIRLAEALSVKLTQMFSSNQP